MTMARVSDVFGGAYLKAENHRNKPRVFTIDGVSTEMVYGEEAYIVYFTDEKRGIKLSQTCANDIAEVLGDDMEAWSGHAMEFYAEDRTIFDREKQCDKEICMWRARAPSSPATSLAKPTATARRPDLDDDIPF